MRAAYVLAVLAPVLAVSAQSATVTASSAQATPTGLTTCITGCSSQAATDAGCSGFADLPCICNSNDFKQAAAACLKENCTSGEVTTANGLNESLCAPFVNATNSIIASGSASLASITASAAAGQSSAIQSLASVANSSVGVLTQSVASAASAASVSATASSAAADAHHLSRGAVFTVGAMFLGAVVGPLALFA